MTWRATFVGPCYAEKLETDHVGLVNLLAELEAGGSVRTSTRPTLNLLLLRTSV